MNTETAKVKSYSILSIEQNSASSLMQEENESIDVQIKFGNETEFFQDMENKLDRLKAFIQSLGSSKNSELNKLLLEHFQRESDEFNEIDSTTIVKETVKRIEK